MGEAPFIIKPLVSQDRTGFDCELEPLSNYLQKQAKQDFRRQVAACFIAIERETLKIAGYYTICAYHLHLTDIAEDLQKKLPKYPTVPAVLLGRLAIDKQFKSRGLGGALITDAVHRAMRSDVIAHMMVVDAKDDHAAAFYQHHGFRRAPEHSNRLYAPLKQLSSRR